MLLETLKEFDWMNEPQYVRFTDEGMHTTAKFKTDFWCCARHNFRKDDGHFFYSYVLGDFCCDLDWSCIKQDNFDQCGIMLRSDVNNWFKASITSDNTQFYIISSLTQEGYSDWVAIPLSQEAKHIWYRLKKRKGCYTAYYSLDGNKYLELRKFYLIHDTDEVKVGPYLCSPQSDDFTAILHSINLY